MVFTGMLHYLICIAITCDVQQMQIPNSTLCQSGNLFTKIQSKLLEKLQIALKTIWHIYSIHKCKSSFTSFKSMTSATENVNKENSKSDVAKE